MTSALITKRAELLHAIRSFFVNRDYLEVDTPLIVPCPGLDLHLDAFEVRDHRGARAGWLSTSPEYQMKRLLSQGLPRIYQLGHAFRCEELGNFHEREFTMLEWYGTNLSSEQMMAETETLVAELAQELVGSTTLQWQGVNLDLEPPWAKIRVADLFEQYAPCSLDEALENEQNFFEIFACEIQPKLGAPKPVFIIDWPASMASLARLKSPSVADRFEAIVAGVELCNGFGELTDAREQLQRFERDQRARKENEKPVYPIDQKFIAALEKGIPPCSGNALGVDRLLMLLCDVAGIAETMAFPEKDL